MVSEKVLQMRKTEVYDFPTIYKYELFDKTYNSNIVLQDLYMIVSVIINTKTVRNKVRSAVN